MAHPTDDRSYRLPTGVRPRRYDAALEVELDGKRFSGRIRVELAIAEPVDELVLHAAELTIPRATLHGGGAPRPARELRLAPASETVVLRFDGPVPAGPATLELEFSGEMSPGLRGMYLAGPGLAATQFEAADARRVFPCLDEPGFKAVWQITVDAPREAVVLSNGAPVREEVLGKLRRVTFAETPPLPSYLVALVVGRVDGLPPLAVRGVPVRTFASPEKVALTGFGQDVAAAAACR